MGFKGSLESINLADIFQNLALNKQSGTMKIQYGGETRYVYFKDGAVRFFSRAKRRGNRLGEMVVGRGLTGLDKVEEALEKQQETGRLLGDILVQMRVVSQEDLASLIRYQIEEDVYETFFLKSGEFEFIDGSPIPEVFDPEQEAVEVQVNTSSLIMEAARRLDERDKMRELIPSTSEIFLPQPALLEMGKKGELEPLEARVLDFLDGGRDVDDIVEESSFSRFEVLSTLVGFHDRGLIRSATLDDLAEAGETCRREGRMRHVIKIYERMLAKGVDTPEIRAHLADAATELEALDKAAIHYGVLAQHNLEKGNEDHAVAILQKIVKLIPKHVPSRTVLAELAGAKGDVAGAMPHYSVLVQTLFEEGRYAEAERYCKDALSLDGEALDVLQVLSRVHAARKEKAEAAAVMVRMGEVLASTGRTRAAEEVLRRAGLTDPASEEVKQKLRSLLEKERATKAHPALWAVVLLVVLALGAVGAVAVVGELRAEGALRSAVEGFKKDGERAVLLRALARPSFRADPSDAVSLLIDSEVEKQKQQLLERLGREREEERRREELAEAKAMLARHDLEGARGRLEGLVDGDGFAKIAAEARRELEKIEAVEAEFRRYRSWLKRHQGDPAMLEQEYRMKMEFQKKYPWSPEAREMKLPLRVVSVPAGADVWVGGRFAGPSPYRLSYRLGERFEVEVKKGGYKTASRTFMNPEKVVAEFVLERQALWHKACEGRVELPLILVGNAILVANRSGKILAFESVSGERLWSHTVSETGLGDVISPFVYYGGSLYFSSGDLRMRAAFPQEGGLGERWSFATEGKVLGRCAVRRLELLNGRLFVFAADETGTVYCVSADKGEELWRQSIGRPVRTDIQVTDRTVYVADTSGRVTGLDVVTGEARWQVRLQAAAEGFVEYRDMFLTITGREMAAFRRDTKPDSSAWIYRLGVKATALPSIVAGRCFAAGIDRKVHCVDPDTGAAIWRPALELDAVGSMPAAGSARRVYFVDVDGTVYAVDTESRSLGWKYACRKPVAAGVLFAEGIVYTVTREGTLFAFEDREE